MMVMVVGTPPQVGMKPPSTSEGASERVVIEVDHGGIMPGLRQGSIVAQCA